MATVRRGHTGFECDSNPLQDVIGCKSISQLKGASGNHSASYGEVGERRPFSKMAVRFVKKLGRGHRTRRICRRIRFAGA
jgi:hypothetical protein